MDVRNILYVGTLGDMKFKSHVDFNFNSKIIFKFEIDSLFEPREACLFLSLATERDPIYSTTVLYTV